MNLILHTDSYKASHFLQYPKGCQTIHSYIESRGGQYHHTLFFGLQMFLKRYLQKPITSDDIAEAKSLITAHGLPFYEEGWRYILEKHHGMLPLRICAVPEGTQVPTRQVLMTVENTDPKCFWLTSYLETLLIQAIWYPTTVATLSHAIKQDLVNFHQISSDSPIESIDFKLHDFGFRGVSSAESAAIGGLAHLVNFKGSDTLVSLKFAQDYYHHDMAGFSIPAAEHSTITSWGKTHEQDAYHNMIQQFGRPGQLFAVVSDSYDIFNAIDHIWGEQLKSEVIQCGGQLVIRPDSGDPQTVPILVIKKLIRHFGYTVNQKGYHVLPECIRVIQGDGINHKNIQQLITNLNEAKLSIDNIAFGMGGALLQHPHRDTMKFAMKCSAAQIDGQWRDVFKDPITDHGKTSKPGRLALIKKNGHFSTCRESELGKNTNYLKKVFENGQLLVDDSLDTIRERAQRSLHQQ